MLAGTVHTCGPFLETAAWLEIGLLSALALCMEADHSGTPSACESCRTQLIACSIEHLGLAHFPPHYSGQGFHVQPLHAMVLNMRRPLLPTISSDQPDNQIDFKDTIACVSFVFYATAKNPFERNLRHKCFRRFSHLQILDNICPLPSFAQTRLWNLSNKGPETVSTLVCWSPSGTNIVKV